MEANSVKSTNMQSKQKFHMDLATRNIGKPIANIHGKSIRSHILDALFGKQNRVLIIVPDGCVDSITFTEKSENGGGCDGQRA